jgi:hypothetical protein
LLAQAGANPALEVNRGGREQVGQGGEPFGHQDLVVNHLALNFHRDAFNLHTKRGEPGKCQVEFKEVGCFASKRLGRLATLGLTLVWLKKQVGERRREAGAHELHCRLACPQRGGSRE